MRVTVAVLAGGLGSRIGGDKALIRLGGRSLISYALSAAPDAGLDAVVVAKRTTRLPELDFPVLLEPDEPTHPLLGIITALERFPAVIALPCDMPFVLPSQLAALAALPDDAATLAAGQPFPSLYRRAVVPQLREALLANRSMRATQAHSLRARALLSSADSLAQINTPEDLAAAEARIRSGD